MIPRSHAAWLGPLLLVGSSTALAAMAFVALRVPVDNAGPWHVGKGLVVVLLGGFAGAAAFALTFLALHVAATVRGVALRHPRAAWTVCQVVGAVAVLLAAAAAVARGWSGQPAGTAAGLVISVICACAVGTASAVLLLGWTLTGPRMGVMRVVVVAASLYLSASCLLSFRHWPPGGTMAAVAVALAFLWTGATRKTPAGPEVILGLGLLFLVVLYPKAGGTVSGAARVLVQGALAVVLGTVTVLWVRRLARWHGRLLRFADAAAVLPLAYVLFLCFDGQLLGGPLEVPLFAPMLWLILRLWRGMQRDPRTWVNAAADIVFALLLGGLVVLFLVWFADVLDLPVTEVRALRAATDHLGELIDLPWWSWAAVDVLLVAVFLAAALGNRPLKRLGDGLGRIRLPRVLEVLRRTLSVLKIVLLTLVFLGLAGPPALAPVLSRHLRDRYTAEWRGDLDARGESALLQQISASLARSPRVLPVLTEMLIRVHDSTGPDSHDTGDESAPMPAARDLAHRMGELQARALLPLSLSLPSLGPSTPEAAEPPAAAAVHDAGLDGTAGDAADLSGRLTREQDQRAAAREREHQEEQVAEHAATLVTGALGNLTFGHGEAIGLVREFLDGLAESGLRTVFLRWTGRLPSGTTPEEPPGAQQLVEPDPAALQRAADLQLTDELTTAGVEIGGDPAQSRDDREPPLTAAVDLAEHTRQLQHGTDACAGCVHYVEPGEHGGRGEEPPIHGE